MPTDPSSLRIEIYPADVLRRRADEIDLTDHTRAVARRMLELMRTADGIGLAAPQVGLSWRLFVADVPRDPDAPPGTDPPIATTAPQVYFNPVIERSEGAATPHSEGCLSLPGITGDVLRPPIVEMSWTDAEGHRQRARAAGLLARCWQHEMDHLDGTLILDRMTEASRLKNRPAVRALERQGGKR